MTTYVERVLQPGEQVRYLATIHWITYTAGFFILLVSVAFLILARSVERGAGFWLAVSGVLALIAIVAIFRAWFDRWITEIAVTDRRVIFKTGFIRRDTKEMQMDKIESVEVLQSILGRALDYGDVIVRGTGHGEFTRIKTIAAPLDMRNQITGV
jgi:uncharacterized membrane protein YdbT with pleckstrin-like domain